jgi:HK97 gp10 family phage protein
MSGDLQVKSRADCSGVLKALAALKAAVGTPARAELEQMMLRAAQPIVDEAKRLAPRGHGAGPRAADTIHAAPQPARKAGQLASVGIGPGDEGWYLRFAETGFTDRAGVFHSARPWLRPAADARIGDCHGILAGELNARAQAAVRR